MIILIIIISYMALYPAKIHEFAHGHDNPKRKRTTTKKDKYCKCIHQHSSTLSHFTPTVYE